MVIAVDTRFLVNDTLNAPGNFIFETTSRLTLQHPGHTFIFIFDGPPDDLFIFPANVIPVTVTPRATGPIQWYIWYNIKIPAVLKKYKATVFVGAAGLCSLTARIPQCLVIHDLSFLHDRSFMDRSHFLFYKKFTGRFIKKCTAVITLSEFTKAAIVKQYATAPGKIEVVYSGVADNFAPVLMEEREAAKKTYANGNEYFIYAGEAGLNKNLLNLLKAFSAFKKRQKSSMYLLIAGKPGHGYEEFQKNLRLFRFKEDVKILEPGSVAELAKVTASAYAMVYAMVAGGFGTSVLQAMKSGVPVITASATAMAEICGDTALYADPANFKDIAIKMMLIFKDENLRRTLIEKGTARAREYNWDRTAALFWNAIERSAVE